MRLGLRGVRPRSHDRRARSPSARARTEAMGVGASSPIRARHATRRCRFARNNFGTSVTITAHAPDETASLPHRRVSATSARLETLINDPCSTKTTPSFMEDALDSMKDAPDSVKDDIDSVKDAPVSMKDGVDSVMHAPDSMKDALDSVKDGIDSVKDAPDSMDDGAGSRVERLGRRATGKVYQCSWEPTKTLASKALPVAHRKEPVASATRRLLLLRRISVHLVRLGHLHRPSRL